MGNSRNGQSRLGCFLMIVMAGCLVAGGQSLYTGLIKILIEDQKPSLGFGVLMILLGVLAGIWTLKIFRG